MYCFFFPEFSKEARITSYAEQLNANTDLGEITRYKFQKETVSSDSDLSYRKTTLSSINTPKLTAQTVTHLNKQLYDKVPKQSPQIDVNTINKIARLNEQDMDGISHEMELRREQVRKTCKTYGLGHYRENSSVRHSYRHPPTVNTDVWYISR